MNRIDPMEQPRAGGFTLVELLLALAAGMVVSGLLLQALLGEERISQRLGRHWREKGNQQRGCAEPGAAGWAGG
jgi:hypothetical protein